MEIDALRGLSWDHTSQEVIEWVWERILSVVENGIDGPFPGTVLKRCSGPVKDLLERANPSSLKAEGISKIPITGECLTEIELAKKSNRYGSKGWTI